MISFLARVVGPKFAPVVLAGLVVVIMVIAGLALRSCTRDTTAQRQAEQTSASGDAMANAAESAIETITNRTAIDRAGDDATAETQREIFNAQDPANVRSAVINSVCRSPAHRNDPACTVR